MPVNTHLVIITGSALGTTRVMIADSTVATTSSAPTPKASTASTVVSTAALLPLAAYRPRRRAAARTRAASPARSLGTQTRFPPAPAMCTSQSSSRPNRSGRPRVGLAAGGDASLGQHRPNAGSQLRGPEIPQPPPRHPRRQAPRPLVHPRIIPPVRLGRRPGLPTMFPAQATQLGKSGGIA